MKKINVQYTLRTTLAVSVSDNATKEEIESRAQQCGEAMQFMLDGPTRCEFRILESE
jgi:hypothetical protein